MIYANIGTGMDADGFYDTLYVYPVTIVPARYGGCYEDAPWLAFPCYPELLDRNYAGWDGDDTTCCGFWIDSENLEIGRGESPNAAYEDLVKRVVEARGGRAFDGSHRRHAEGVDRPDYRDSETWANVTGEERIT